jgi:transcriptional regulator with XRE-family HTH domain
MPSRANGWHDDCASKSKWASVRHNDGVSENLGRLLREADVRELGQRIRDKRVGLKLTQTALADGHMSIAYISRIEAGQRRPELAMLEVIARRLGASVEELLCPVEDVEPPEDEFRAAVRFAQLVLRSGDANEAERVSAELLKASEGDAQREPLILELREVHAQALEAQGNVRDAVRELEAILRSTQPSLSWALTAARASYCYRELGSLDRAVSVTTEPLLWLSANDLSQSAEAVQLLLSAAAAQYERGDQAHATDLADRAVAAADEMGSRDTRAQAYWAASVLESGAGRHSNAVTLAERALMLLVEGEDERNVARLRAELGLLMLRAADPNVDQARTHLVRARGELVENGGGAVDIGRCDVNLALADLLDGDTTGAIDRATSALSRIGVSAPSLAGSAHQMVGRAKMMEGDTPAAQRSFAAAAAALTAAGSDRAAAQVWFELAGHFDAVGDADRARDAYRSAAAASGLRAVDAPMKTRPART